MSSWEEFRERASNPWEVRFGEAHRRIGTNIDYVRIRVPKNALTPSLLRYEWSKDHRPVEFEFETLSPKGRNDPQDTQSFIINWILLWKDNLKKETFVPESNSPPAYTIPTPPADFKYPARLEFDGNQLSYFDSSPISKSPLAPMFGQKSDYLDEELFVLDSGPDQDFNRETTTIFRQTWLDKMLCPFCNLTGFSRASICVPRPPEQAHYGSGFLVLCPRCDRVTNTLPV